MKFFKDKHNVLLVVCIIIFIIHEILGGLYFENFIPPILYACTPILDLVPFTWFLIFAIGFLCSKLKVKNNIFVKVYNFTMEDKVKSAISYVFLIPALLAVSVFCVVAYYFIKFVKENKGTKSYKPEKGPRVFKFDFGTVVGYDDSNGNKYIKRVVYVSGIQDMGLADYDFIDPNLINNYTLERFEQNEFEIYIGDRKLTMQEMHRLPANPKTYNFFNWQY